MSIPRMQQPATPVGGFGGDIGTRADFIHPTPVRRKRGLSRVLHLYKLLYIMRPEAGLGTLFRQASSALDGGVQQVYDRRNAHFRPRYFSVARHLLDQGPTGVMQLSDALGSTQPAISQTLKEMEREGLISFEAGGDRRVRLARLSPKGQEVCRQLQPIWSAAARCAEELGDELGIDLTDLLTRLIASLQERPFSLRIEEKLQ